MKRWYNSKTIWAAICLIVLGSILLVRAADVVGAAITLAGLVAWIARGVGMGAHESARIGTKGSGSDEATKRRSDEGELAASARDQAMRWGTPLNAVLAALLLALAGCSYKSTKTTDTLTLGASLVEMQILGQSVRWVNEPAQPAPAPACNCATTRPTTQPN